MEQLICDLNSPRNQGKPDAINIIQRQIQRLQREPAAWQTGLQLLGSDEQLLQFYGALTISLKVNADWEADKIGQDRDQVSRLLQHLITRFIHLASSSDSDVVVNKLSSTLAAVFAKPDTAWAHPCRHVLACILEGKYISEEQVPDLPQILATQTSISGSALKAVSHLSLALQEESNSSSKNQTGHRNEVQLSNNAVDAWQLLHFAIRSFCIRSGIEQPALDALLQVETTDHYFVKVLAEALQQIPIWSKAVAAEDAPESTLFRLFAASVQLTIRLLDQPVAADHCMPCLATLQADHHRLLARAIPEYRSQINASDAASRWTAELLAGDFSPEANSFVDFLEAVISQLDTTVDDYLKDNEILRILERVQSLLRCRGAAMVEDEICQTVLEIITTVAEGYSDWSEPSPFDEGMNNLVGDACLATLIKCQFPAEELDKRTATWEDDDFTRFEDFRFQASDFFQTAFGILGPSLAQDIARSISQPQAAWPEFEAAIFVLTSVSDALSNEPEKCDPYLNQVFSSSLWNRAVSPAEDVPGRVRRSVIKLLAETTSYLQRNFQHLIGCLDFLFRSLQIRGHSNQAARAIYSLCDSQRSYLVQALPQFLQTITTLENIPLHSCCKILSGVSALIQALPSEQDKIESVQRLLQLIQELEAKHTIDPPTSDDEIYNPLFDRVSMLAAIARGLQSPADTPIDLEPSTNTDGNFWLQGPGKPTQEAILQMLSDPWNQLLQPDKSDLVTVACEFLKAGFKEQHPVPTKFSAAISTELLCSIISLQNPNLDQTMNTASCFVASSAPPSPDNSTEADALINRVLTITQEATRLLQNPTSDFTAPTSILDFFVRSMPKYGLHVLTHPSALDIMTTFVDFAITLLRSTTDTLPRRSAAAFFTSFLDITDPSSTLMKHPQANANLTALMDKYSPTVLGLTIHLLAGECARSEIESLSQLLRAFISKQPLHSKRILQEAIKSESGVLTPKALEATKPEQRSRFVTQVEVLRGGRKTTEIVRDFWINCKGGQFGYIT